MVDMVDVKVAVATAAGPQEAMEAFDLPHHFGRVSRPFGRECRSNRAVHAVTAHKDHIADFPVLDALVEFLQRAAVPGHQADAHLQILLGSLFRKAEHAFAGRAVHGDRLLHEHVQALFDGVGEVDPAECRGGG